MSRVLSFDIFRGILIVGMIVAHTVLNFYNPDFAPAWFYWVPVGFMLFLGVIIGQFLAEKPAKNFWLAGKLGLIFLLANALTLWHLTWPQSLKSLLYNNQEIFSFEILWSMAIFLLSAPFLIYLQKKIPTGWAYFLLLSFGIILMLDFTDFYAYNLLFWLYGASGLFLGLSHQLPIWQQNLQRTFPPQFLIFFILFLLQCFNTFIFFSRAISVAEGLLLFCLIPVNFKGNRLIIFLGKNSLSIYLVQVILLQLLKKWADLTVPVSLIILTCLIVIITALSGGGTFLLGKFIKYIKLKKFLRLNW